MESFIDPPTGPIHRFLNPIGHDPLESVNTLLSFLPGNPGAAETYLTGHSDLSQDEAANLVKQLIDAMNEYDDDAVCELSNIELHRSPDEIADATHQATARVWYSRGVDKQRYQKVMEANYPDLDAYEDEWEHGYLSGVLAALRWVQGDGWASLDT